MIKNIKMLRQEWADKKMRVDCSRQGDVLGYWVDEGVAATATDFLLERMELKLRKVGALGYMTDELLQDAPALGGELEAAFSRELIFQVENKIYRGLGTRRRSMCQIFRRCWHRRMRDR